TRGTGSSRPTRAARTSSSTSAQFRGRGIARSTRARRWSTRPSRVRRAHRPRTSASSRPRFAGGGRWSPPPARVPTNEEREEATIAQKEDKVEMTGEIVEALRNGMFRIKLDNGHETLGYTAGKMRRFRIRMNPGDRVRI